MSDLSAAFAGGACLVVFTPDLAEVTHKALCHYLCTHATPAELAEVAGLVELLAQGARRGGELQ